MLGPKSGRTFSIESGVWLSGAGCQIRICSPGQAGALWHCPVGSELLPSPTGQCQLSARAEEWWQPQSQSPARSPCGSGARGVSGGPRWVLAQPWVLFAATHGTEPPSQGWQRSWGTALSLGCPWGIPGVFPGVFPGAVPGLSLGCPWSFPWAVPGVFLEFSLGCPWGPTSSIHPLHSVALCPVRGSGQGTPGNSVSWHAVGWAEAAPRAPGNPSLSGLLPQSCS